MGYRYLTSKFLLVLFLCLSFPSVSHGSLLADLFYTAKLTQQDLDAFQQKLDQQADETTNLKAAIKLLQKRMGHSRFSNAKKKGGFVSA